MLCAVINLIVLCGCGNQNNITSGDFDTSNISAETTTQVVSPQNDVNEESNVSKPVPEELTSIEITVDESVLETESKDDNATSSRVVLVEPMYPDEHYPIVGDPPHDISLYADLCANTKDLIDFINNTDEHTYINGYYCSFFRATRDIGYVLKPKFDGVDLDEMIANKQVYGIGVNFEEGYCGPSYSYSLDIENYKHRIFINPLKKEWIEAAKERPFLYEYGKKWYDYDFAEAAKYGWTKHKIQDGKYTVYKDKYSQVYWAYDDFLIRIVFRFSEDIDTVLDTAEKLTFEKVPLNQSDE